MFVYLEDLEKLWLMALWGLWAIFLFGGFLRGHESETHRTPRRARLLSSAVLVLAALSWYVIVPGGFARAYALLIVMGMACGFLGDLILAGFFPGGRNVLGGIIAFGIGHLFYIGGILRYSSQMGLEDPARRWGALVMWLLIALVAWYFLIFRGQQATVLHWAALPYALLLASTTGLAAGLALQAPLFWGLAAGAALFLLSDLILAAQLFTGLTFKSIGDVIWLTYGPGQMLIVYSVGMAVQLLKGT